MGMNLFELRKERKTELDAAEAVLDRAAKEKRDLTAAENSLIEEHLAAAKKLNPRIEEIESKNSIFQYDPVALLSGRLIKPGQKDPYEESENHPGEHPRAAALKRKFGAWARRAVGNLTGVSPNGDIITDSAWKPEIDASSPSGVISIGTGTGLDSVNFAIPTEVLPFMKSYFGFSPFEKAGSSIISTRPHEKHQSAGCGGWRTALIVPRRARPGAWLGRVTALRFVRLHDGRKQEEPSGCCDL